MQAFELLASKDMLTEDNIRLANYLGWCVEMVIMFDEFICKFVKIVKILSLNEVFENHLNLLKVMS